VYPNHAQVTREILVDARPGDNTVTFTALVPTLNPENLRATASEGLRITGTETRTVFLRESLSEEIKALDRRIQELSDAIAALERSSARWKEERLFYSSIKQRVSSELGKELTENRISVADWESMLQFVRKGLEECDRQMSVIGLEKRERMKELEVLTHRRNAYVQRRPKEMKEVTVSFSAAKAGQKAIRIHYIVPSARWVPIYDVHLDRESKTVQVIGYGHVAQWTGENWENVDLTLAMSRPDFEMSLPELKPLVASLDAQEMQQLARDITELNEAPQQQARQWAKRRFKGQQGYERFRRNLEQLAEEDDAQLMQFGLNRKIITEALTRLVDRFAGVRYEVARAETIPCDNSPHKVVVFSSTVPVDLKHVATPALGETVVLRGDVKNTTGHPILEGDISLFIDNSYVGASKTTSAALNEGLSFCFGPDDALVVERELVKRTVQDPEMFRESQIITYRYSITVENFNDRVASVEIADQIPISKQPDVRVTFLESNEDHRLDEPTGKLAWAIDVDPGKRSEITFLFSIECPADRTVYWM
jgi:uncharacterized protein (TIGR02231 family)